MIIHIYVQVIHLRYLFMHTEKNQDKRYFIKISHFCTKCRITIHEKKDCKQNFNS